jgi:thiol-disulfide isomerase/thioredoxin
MILVASVVGFGRTPFATGDGRGPQIGSVPPPLELSRIIQGPAIERVNWSELKGKVVVLEFWNTGCTPCVEAIRTSIN